jgi:GT2 family glycosyltransferase
VRGAGVKRTVPIAVGISTRDRHDALAACLDALASGTVLPAQLIVVDQSAGVQTRDLVEERRAAFPRVDYVPHRGQGLGAAQNETFAHAASPVIAVTDDDCVPAPTWLETIDRVLADASGLAGVTGRVLPLGPERPNLYAVSSRESNERRDFSGRTLPWDVGSGNNFAVRREWLVDVGGNDERLGPGSPGRGGVDMDLFYRLRAAGARLRYEPDSVVYHARTTRRGRLERRFPYGHGMGAACILWLRRGDRYALRVLGAWLSFRLRRLAAGTRHRQWSLVHEELLVLAGTLRGLVHGARTGRRHR